MKKVRVTPEMAKEWLSYQAVNRRLATSVVSRYHEAMVDGKWRCDDQLPLRFDEQGKLVDGQHRLNAVIEYGKPVDFYIATVTLETLDLLHECKTRSTSDRLVLTGSFDQNTAKYVSALGTALCDRRHAGKLYAARKKQSLSMRAYRPDQIVGAFEWAGVDPIKIVETARGLYSMQPSKYRLIGPTLFGYLLSQKAPNALEVLYGFASDEHPNRTTSMTTLRRQLGNTNYSVSVKLAMLAKAINYPDLKVIRVENYVEDLIGGTFKKFAEEQSNG